MRKRLYSLVLSVFILAFSSHIACAQTPAEWNKLSLGMKQGDVLALLGKPVGTMTMSNTKGLPQAALTEKARNSLEFTLWSYNKAGTPLEASDGRLIGKTLRFNTDGVLIEIPKKQ